MTARICRAAEERLSAEIAATSGDLVAAFVRLCSTVTAGDVESETYREALERVARRVIRPRPAAEAKSIG